MPTYVNAATVRIQLYIARTPRLRLRRGASWMITRATSPDQVDEWIRTSSLVDVIRNPEAGEVGGVVSLIAPDGRGEAVATALLEYLRSELPGAELEAEWAAAPTYLDALNELKSFDTDRLVALPPLTDFPLAETCERCRVDIRLGSNTDCLDCEARDAAAGYLDDADDERVQITARGVEKRLLEAVKTRRGIELKPVSMLEELATYGEVDGNRNHLATISADGNALGTFFSALTGADVSLKRRVSPAVTEATFAALVTASSAVVVDGDVVLPVVPHVVGGDDVVVSVIADRAWKFVTEFLRAFEHELVERIGPTAIAALAVGLPTMSASIIFAQASSPIARIVHLAETALRRAKSAGQGMHSTICWLDITVDGEQIPAWRMAFTVDELEARRTELEALASIGNSGRQALSRLLADRKPDEADAAARVWARKRSDMTVPQVLTDSDPRTLRNLVTLVRWWRP